MKDFPIPVRAIGPGSQPVEGDACAVLDVPREMATFEMPHVPERVAPGRMLAARDVLAAWLDALRAQHPSDAPGAVLDLAGTPPEVLELLNQVLGEGEVAIRVEGQPALRIQESVFAGLWRCLQIGPAGELQRDWLEAGPVPAAVLDRARAAAADGLCAVDLPPGAMNSPALLAEIAARRRDVGPGVAAGVINLTLLPMSDDDHRVLERALPVGPVAMISRSFGNCHVTSTRVRDVWRVQFFNSMRTLILDTLEIVRLPEAAIAAPEDLADSLERLAELIAWMGEAAADEGADRGAGP